MKLGTLKDASRDGRLVVVSRDGKRFLPVGDVCPTMQCLLDNWIWLVVKLMNFFNDLIKTKPWEKR